MDIADIGATLIEPLEKLTEGVSQVINAIGTGVEFSGEEIEKFALLVAVLSAKVEELQAHLRQAGDQ